MLRNRSIMNYRIRIVSNRKEYSTTKKFIAVVNTRKVIIMNGQNMKKFVRYADGAKMYSMGKTKFQELAKEAQACYKIGQLVLVNTEILDKYLEKYHITDSDFYK